MKKRDVFIYSKLRIPAIHSPKCIMKLLRRHLLYGKIIIIFCSFLSDMQFLVNALLQQHTRGL